MSAPTTHDPLVVNTKDGAVWQRRAVTADGRGLYAVTGSCSCPEYLMATLAELAAHGIAGSADVLPMPVGVHVPPWPPAPRDFEEKLRQDVARLQGLHADAVRDVHRANRERDLMRERVSEPFGCAHCGEVKRSHGRRYIGDVGMHSWERPTDEQVKARMLARRAARLAVDVMHDAGRRDRYAKALYEFVNGAFVWEACDDGASWLEEADAAIVVADAEQAEWRDRVDEVERKYIVDTAELKRRIAELESERHTTNEALDDAVQALRARSAMVCRTCGEPVRWVEAKLSNQGWWNHASPVADGHSIVPMPASLAKSGGA
ncbi:hypothetical protein ACGFY9_14190 [Streptomyces sp. NPDC048504]|uniref:hypothetical protein n=1 Tax=Streptomyces sp. NPDC048504 TaxID=3365559 RepID=UPI003716F7F8